MSYRIKAIYNELTEIEIKVLVVQPNHMLQGHIFELYGSIADLANKSLTELITEQLDHIIYPLPGFKLISMQAISYYDF